MFWKLISEEYKDKLESNVNSLMDKYNFKEFKFVVSDGIYYALILLEEKR